MTVGAVEQAMQGQLLSLQVLEMEDQCGGNWCAAARSCMARK